MSATAIMRYHNPLAVHGQEGGREIFIEDVLDPDGRVYRVEYRCRANGSDATAYVLRNPWGNNPYDYAQSHLSKSGFICIGPDVTPSSSPFDLGVAINQTRFWCAGYSYMREHGYEEACRVLPEWRWDG